MRKELEIERQKIEEEKERIRVSDPSTSRRQRALELQRQVQKENEIATMRKQYERDLRNIQVSVNDRCPDVQSDVSIPEKPTRLSSDTTKHPARA